MIKKRADRRHHRYGGKYKNHFDINTNIKLSLFLCLNWTLKLKVKSSEHQRSSSTLITSIGWTNIHAEIPLAPAMPKLTAVGILTGESGGDLVAMVSRESWSRVVHLGLCEAVVSMFLCFLVFLESESSLKIVACLLGVG